MLVRDLQALLAKLYAIELAADVCDFLVTDARVLRALDPENSSERQEKLLLEEGQGELAVALYLDAALLERLGADDPRQCLCGNNLDDFCTVLEGVSHFNYIAWNAAIDKPVTLLELEMQAEIDKYAAARILLSRQKGSDIGERLHARLFEDAAFDERMSVDDLERYRLAWQMAGRYCHSLESRFPPGAPATGMLRELRTFFRWPQPAKFSHIRSAALA